MVRTTQVPIAFQFSQSRLRLRRLPSASGGQIPYLTISAAAASVAGNKRGGRRRSSRTEGSMGDLYTWLIAFFILIALLIIIVYQLMCLADLEFDYINPYDSSSRINKVIIPEFAVQGALCLFYLFTGHWVMSLLCAPYLYYNVTLYQRKQHLVDVTEIFNLLHWEKKQRLFKLGYLVVLLFFSLFWMIYSALEEED